MLNKDLQGLVEQEAESAREEGKHVSDHDVVTGHLVVQSINALFEIYQIMGIDDLPAAFRLALVQTKVEERLTGLLDLMGSIDPQIAEQVAELKRVMKED